MSHDRLDQLKQALDDFARDADTATDDNQKAQITQHFLEWITDHTGSRSRAYDLLTAWQNEGPIPKYSPSPLFPFWQAAALLLVLTSIILAAVLAGIVFAPRQTIASLSTSIVTNPTQVLATALPSVLAPILTAPTANSTAIVKMTETVAQPMVVVTRSKTWFVVRLGRDLPDLGFLSATGETLRLANWFPALMNEDDTGLCVALTTDDSTVNPDGDCALPTYQSTVSENFWFANDAYTPITVTNGGRLIGVCVARETVCSF